MSALALGVRLCWGRDRGARGRVALMAAGSALGIALLLCVLTAPAAIWGRDVRSAWLSPAPSESGGVLFRAAPDQMAGRDLTRVYVADLGTSPAPAVPAGLTRWPAPNRYAVSPALRDLLAADPTGGLRERFVPAAELAAEPGTGPAAGSGTGRPLDPDVLPEALVPSPDSLVAVVGVAPPQARALGARAVAEFPHAPRTRSLNGAFVVLLGMAAIGTLTPIVLFLVASSRIAAARRTQRMAAIRLVGATPGQAFVIALAEAAVPAGCGALAGAAVFALLRPVLARVVTFDGLHFVADDIAVAAPLPLAVVVAVPVLNALAAAIAVVPPSGPRRRARRGPGRWRLAVLGGGVAGFLAATAARQSWGTQSGAFQGVTLGSLLLMLVGTLLAGPLACAWIARIGATHARSAGALIAARHVVAAPYGTFRAVAGVVLACFVTTLFLGTVPSPDRVLDSGLRPHVLEVLPAITPDRLPGDAEIERVVTVSTLRRDPQTAVVPCAELTRLVSVTCPDPRISAAGLPPPGLRGTTGFREAAPAEETQPRATYLLVRDDAAEDRARTAVARVAPGALVTSRLQQVALDGRQIRELLAGLHGGTAFVLLVSVAGLFVGLASSIADRRRPLALLRAAGATRDDIAAISLHETTLPLVVTSLVAIGAALLTTRLLAHALGQDTPEVAWWQILLLLGTVAAAAALTLAARPMVDGLTRPTTVRYE